VTARRAPGGGGAEKEEAIMTEPMSGGGRVPGPSAAQGLPTPADRAEFEAKLAELRVREKAHTRQGDAIAAARRRLPMVEMDAALPLIGADGPVTLLDAFEGRRQLIAYFHMWHEGRPAADQCEGCTWNNTQVTERSYLYSRDITYAVLCQGPYEESRRYRDFMNWDLPWYSAKPSPDALLVGRRIGMMHVVCYVRDGDRVFETYWTTGRGVEAVDHNYRLMDLTVWGRQESWEDSPGGWPQQCTSTRSRPRGGLRAPAGRIHVVVVLCLRLAGELAACPDHGLAFAACERIMRPYVDSGQQLPPGGIRAYAPQSQPAIWARWMSTRLMASRPPRGLTRRLFFSKAAAIDLPEYSCWDLSASL
jgi:predicted dithiol-disulfide oxidoreductase (DUF899 family)